MDSSFRIQARLILAILFILGNSDVLAQTGDKCSASAYRAFDFWIGEWQVTGPDGQLAGRNLIEKIHDGCALRENWSSATSSFTGTSLNFYNQRLKQWHQTWVDNQGGSLDLNGTGDGSTMTLASQVALDAQGREVKHTITWTKNKDGSVRQLWETSTNGEISTAFDGLYTKIK